MSFDFRQTVLGIFSRLKVTSQNTPTPNLVRLKSGSVVRFVVLSRKLSTKDMIIRRMAVWRSRNAIWFPSQFRVTYSGTAQWLKKQLIDEPDRILFLLYRNKDLIPFGHIGLYRFDFKNRTCEIDNIMRGRMLIGTEGAITMAVGELIRWTYEVLGVRKITLRVFGDNIKAMNLYKRLGFVETNRMALKKIIQQKVVSWIDDRDTNPLYAQRVFVEMVHRKDFH